MWFLWNPLCFGEKNNNNKSCHRTTHYSFSQLWLSSSCGSGREMSPESIKVNKADMAQALPHRMESLFLCKIKKSNAVGIGHLFPRITSWWGEEGDAGCYDSLAFWRRQYGEVIFVMNCWGGKWCDRKCHSLGLRENQQLAGERLGPPSKNWIWKKKFLNFYIYDKERGLCGEWLPLPWVQIRLQSVHTPWQTQPRALGKSWGYIFLFEECCQIANLDLGSFSAT